LVKIFPADALGKNYIKSIQPVFPGMNFMPTGGINADVGRYLICQEWKQLRWIGQFLVNQIS
jgi:2-keto-3-deoxy-6-phosphogluconate aldolase